jgi:hypothetical protein
MLTVAEQQKLGGSILAVVRNNILVVDENGALTRMNLPYNAIGSAAQNALGAFGMQYKLIGDRRNYIDVDPHKFLNSIMEICVEQNTSVGPPFIVLSNNVDPQLKT